MIKAQKVFSKADYKDNEKAYNTLIKYFAYLYPVLRKEDYGIDVDVYIKKVDLESNVSPVAKLELEVKHNWKGQKFPFNDVQFLAKKQKFVQDKIVPFWLLFNDDYTNCGIIQMHKITFCELDVVYCKGIGNDFFYRIPTSKMVWGIDKIEKTLIAESFDALNAEHQRMLS